VLRLLRCSTFADLVQGGIIPSAGKRATHPQPCGQCAAAGQTAQVCALHIMAAAFAVPDVQASIDGAQEDDLGWVDVLLEHAVSAATMRRTHCPAGVSSEHAACGSAAQHRPPADACESHARACAALAALAAASTGAGTALLARLVLQESHAGADPSDGGVVLQLAVLADDALRSMQAWRYWRAAVCLDLEVTNPIPLARLSQPRSGESCRLIHTSTARLLDKTLANSVRCAGHVRAREQRGGRRCMGA
jgi:hypothetical protein